MKTEGRCGESVLPLPDPKAVCPQGRRHQGWPVTVGEGEAATLSPRHGGKNHTRTAAG